MEPPEKPDPKVLPLKPRRERPEDVGVTVRIDLEELVEPPPLEPRKKGGKRSKPDQASE
jgi:hypothetical protein